MDIRFQVFVSSTYVDLQAERQEVIQALLEMDCIPAGMELFPAANEDQWSLIKEVIDDCDYYLVVVGGRYGTITEEGISYTEKEYDYAVEQNKPILGFVHADPDSLPRKNTELDSRTHEKFEQFRSKVKSRPIREYNTADQLGSVVSRSLQRLIKKEPGEGWVKGRFANRPEQEDENSRLRARVAELELDLERKEASSRPEVVPHEELAQGDDQFPVSYIATIFANGQDVELHQTSVMYSWSQLFQLLGPTMWDHAREEELSEKLSNNLLNFLKRTGQLDSQQLPSIKLIRESLDSILIQFRALDYIAPEMGGISNAPGWTLTGHGNRALVELTAIRRQVSSDTTS